MASNVGPSKKRKVMLIQAISDEDIASKPQKKYTKTKEAKNVPAKQPQVASASKQGAKTQALTSDARTQQGLWLLHCRNNLVPGSTGAKEWSLVTEEFNEHFKNELSKDLSWKTLQKRYGEARKLYKVDHPDYDEIVKCPVPPAQMSEDEACMDMDIVDESDNDEVLPRDKVASPATNIRPVMEAPIEEAVVQNQVSKTHLPSAGSSQVVPAKASGWTDEHPGAYISSFVSSNRVSPIDRVKYHLRRRCNIEDTATFNLFDAEPDDIDELKAQHVDHTVLLEISPFYARFARSDPDKPIPVPKHICAKTVNAFLQLIAPVRAITLPTHYFWHSETPIAGIYDRFGAIEPEQIHWSVDTLLELDAFARYMEVYWICDMIIDRLHWMFTEQKKLRDACRILNVGQDVFVDLNGKKRWVGTRLPYVPGLEHCSLAVEDFDTIWLSRLGTAPVDLQMLTFIADLMRSLGGTLPQNWLHRAAKHIQDIFKSEARPPFIEDGPRSSFCAAYHHHAANESCYNTIQTRPDNYFIHSLYATSTRDELLTLSTGVAPPNNLASIMHLASGSKEKLKTVNSSPQMLEAEKLVLEMEMRLERAKMALEKARGVGMDRKEEKIAEAKEVAIGMFGETKVVRK